MFGRHGLRWSSVGGVRYVRLVFLAETILS
jgi:hypothetical protein